MSIEDEVPESLDRKVPKFLTIIYIILLLGGFWAFYLYWNGSHGFLDRGYWQTLQNAANTTYPFAKKEPYLCEEHILKIREFEH